MENNLSIEICIKPPENFPAEHKWLLEVFDSDGHSNVRKQLWIALRSITHVNSKAQILFGNVSQQRTTIILLIGLLIKCIAIDITSFPVIKFWKGLCSVKQLCQL